MKGVTVISHPLVQHNLTRLRDEQTQPQEFRRVLSEVAALMIYEATRTFATETVSVHTPLAKTTGRRLSREVVLVPVLRAGLGMLDSILQLIPKARVGFIGRCEHCIRIVGPKHATTGLSMSASILGKLSTSDEVGLPWRVQR